MKGFTPLQFQVRTYEGACKFSVLFPHIEYAGNSVVQTDSSIWFTMHLIILKAP